MRISPLRIWLQSTSVLAVLAGYSLLLLFNQNLAGLQRRLGHEALAQQLMLALQARVQRPAQLPPVLRSALLPGISLRELEPAMDLHHRQPTLLQRRDGQWVLISRQTLPLADGQQLRLRMEQNVTTSVQQEQLGFWLLVVAAGVSILFTSGLLRLVIARGLVLPLEEFQSQLTLIQAPPTPDDAIELSAQPEELRPIAEAFNALQARLVSSWERQRAFVDGVAHELRLPITLISGHAQSLLRQSPRDTPGDPLRLILEEAQRMGSLVSDLLDLARRDSDRLTLRREPIEADDTLLAVFERMAGRTAGRLQIDPGGATAGDLPQGVGDPERLQQCLTALVDNALLYSPAPRPVVLASSCSTRGDLVLHVRDRGPGVQSEERERIFERFARGSAALAQPSRGSGIGLSVVRLLMEAMGGRVEVCDNPAGGADFQLHLPSLTPSAAPPSA